MQGQMWTLQVCRCRKVLREKEETLGEYRLRLRVLEERSSLLRCWETASKVWGQQARREPRKGRFPENGGHQGQVLLKGQREEELISG